MKDNSNRAAIFSHREHQGPTGFCLVPEAMADEVLLLAGTDEAAFFESYPEHESWFEDEGFGPFFYDSADCFKYATENGIEIVRSAEVDYY